MFQIIPAIDMLGGNVVRLKQGDYQAVQQYDYSPEGLARYYQTKGFRRIHLVDLDGAKAGKIVNQSALKTIRETTDIELDFGGGIRSKEMVQTLFDLGINYVVLGSLLLKNTVLAIDLFHAFPYRIIAGIDLKQGNIAVEGWLEKSKTPLTELLNILSKSPVHSIIYTDIERDGMMMGPNLEGLKQFAQLTSFPIIASGGVSSDADIDALRQLEGVGIQGAIVGKALLDGKITQCL